MAFADKKKAHAYINSYNKRAYDRVTILLPKGYKEKLKELSGGSVTAYIKAAIDAEMKKSAGN